MWWPYSGLQIYNHNTCGNSLRALWHFGLNNTLVSCRVNCKIMQFNGAEKMHISIRNLCILWVCDWSVRNVHHPPPQARRKSGLTWCARGRSRPCQCGSLQTRVMAHPPGCRHTTRGPGPDVASGMVIYHQMVPTGTFHYQCPTIRNNKELALINTFEDLHKTIHFSFVINIIQKDLKLMLILINTCTNVTKLQNNIMHNDILRKYYLFFSFFKITITWLVPDFSIGG